MANCTLGNIVNPQNNYVYQTLQLPITLPLVVNSPTEPDSFLVQVSKSPIFTTQDAQIISSNGSVSIVIAQDSVYYLRISCDGTTWSGNITFTISTVTPKDLSSINNMIAALNGNSIDILIPQLMYGRSFTYDTSLNNVIYSNNNINNAQILEIQVSQDPNFITNVYYQMYYPENGWDLISIQIPNMVTSSTYYIQARIYVNNEWEAYTNSQQSTSINT